MGQQRGRVRAYSEVVEAWNYQLELLLHARQLAAVRHLAQADPAQAELAEDRVRATATLAAGVTADRELRLASRP